MPIYSRMTKSTVRSLVPRRNPRRDAETLRLLLARDADGLRRLLRDHAGKVRSVLRKELRSDLSHLDVDAVISEAAHRVWELAPELFDARRGSLPAWFLAIARSCARRVQDSNRSHAFAPLNGAMVAEGSVARVVESRDALEQVHQCLVTLQPLQRAVVLADLASGGTAPTDELAAELGATPNAIYVSRCLARKRLREVLGEPAAATGRTSRRTMP